MPVGGAAVFDGLREVHVAGRPVAAAGVALGREHGVVGVGCVLRERHDVGIGGGVVLVLEGATPHGLADVLAAGVHLVDAAAPVGALHRVARGLTEVRVDGFTSLGGGADAQLVVRARASLVPGVAVGRLDGNALDFPAVVVGVVRGAVVVLAPLAEVLVALVEATLLDEELLARRGQPAAFVHVVIGVEVALLGVAHAVKVEEVSVG